MQTPVRDADAVTAARPAKRAGGAREHLRPEVVARRDPRLRPARASRPVDMRPRSVDTRHALYAPTVCSNRLYARTVCSNRLHARCMLEQRMQRIRDALHALSARMCANVPHLACAARTKPRMLRFVPIQSPLFSECSRSAPRRAGSGPRPPASFAH